MLLAAIAWDGGGDGTSWHDANNWNPNQIPGVNDDATINVAGTPTIAYNATTGTRSVNSLVCAETINFTGGNLTVVTTATLQSAAAATVNGGTLTGGTWSVTGGTFNSSTNANSTLDGVTVLGDIQMPGLGTRLRLVNSVSFSNLLFTGAIAASSAVAFSPGSHITGNIVRTGSGGGAVTIEMTATGTLTIDPGAQVRIAPGAANILYIGLVSVYPGTMTLVNQGTISCEAAALNINAASFTNTGATQVTAGTLTFNSPSLSNSGLIQALTGGTALFPTTLTVTTAQLGDVRNVSGTVRIEGTINNASAVLSLNSTTGIWTIGPVSSTFGTISGGTLSVAAGFEPVPNLMRLANGVTWNGNLTIPGANPYVTVTGGLTFNGTMTISSTNRGIAFDGGAQTFGGNASVLMTGSGATFSGGNSAVVTIASTVTIQGRGGINQGNLIVGTATFINNGLIRNDGGAGLTIGPLAGFTNNGTVEANNVGSLTLTSITSFTNISGTSPNQTLTGGTWRVVSGSLSFQSMGITTNAATIYLDSGTTWSQITSLATNSGTLELANGRAFNFTPAGNLFLNSGTFRKSGTGSTSVGATITFNNAGTVSTTGGTLTLGGPVPQVSGSTLTGGIWSVADSTLVISGAAVTTNQAAVTLSGPTSTFAALDGLTSNSGSYYIAAGRTKTLSTLTNIGTVGVAGTGSALTVTGTLFNSAAFTIDAGTLTGSGGGTQSGSVTFLNGGLVNFAGSTALAGFSSFGGGGTVTNSGTLSRSVAGTTTFGASITFSNTGTLSVSAGTVSLPGPVAQISGSTLTGGTWQVHGDTGGAITTTTTVTQVNAGASVFLFSSTNLVNLPQLQTVGGSLLLDNLIVSDTQAAGLTVTGTLNLLNNSSLTVQNTMTTTAGTVVLSGSSLIAPLAGAAGVFSLTGGTLTNSGTLNLDTAAGSSINGAGVVHILGSLTKTSVGSITIPPTVTLDNTGSVSALLGSLIVQGPVSQVIGGALTGGVWNVSTGATLDLSGANITTNNTNVTIGGSGGSFLGLQNLAVNNGTLTLGNGSAWQFTPAGGVFTNPGEFFATGSGTITVPPTVAFNNQGNSVHIAVGTTLVFQGGGTNTGDYDVAAGAAVVFSAGNFTFSTDTTFYGGGDVTFAAGTNTVSGPLQITGTLTISGGSTTFSGAVGDGSAMERPASISIAGGTATFSGPFLFDDFPNTPVTVAPGATAIFANANSFAGTLTNSGTVTASGSGYLRASLPASDTGNFTLQGGHLNLDVAGASSSHTGDFTLSANGLLELLGANTFAPGSDITGTGTVSFAFDTSTSNGQINLTGTLRLVYVPPFGAADTTLVANGPLTATTIDFIAFGSGFGNGQPKLTINGTASAGTLGVNQFFLGPATLSVGAAGSLGVAGAMSMRGTVNVTGGGAGTGLSASGGGTQTDVTFNLSSGGAVNLNGIHTLSGATGASGAGTVTNLGTLVSTAAATTTFDAGVTYSNPGTTSVTAGTLAINGPITQRSGSTLTAGTWSIASGAALAIGGSITTSSATILLTGTGTFAALNALAVNTGSITLAAAHPFSFAPAGNVFSNAGSFTLSGTGSVHVPAAIAFDNSGSSVSVAGGSFFLDGGGTHSGHFDVATGAKLYFSGGIHSHSGAATITGAGDVEVSAGTMSMGGTVIIGGALTVSGGTATFDASAQAATVAVSGTAVATFNASYQVPGTTTVQAGQLSLLAAGARAGDFLLSAGGRLSFGGNHTFASTSDITGSGDFEFLSGTSTCAGTVNITGSALFTGTNENFSNTFHAGAIVINSVSTVSFSGPTDATSLQDDGTLSMVGAAGTLIIFGDGTLTGTVTRSGGAAVTFGGTTTFTGSASVTGSGIIINTGTMVRTGAGTTSFGSGITLDNPGMVEVFSGTLAFNGSVVQVQGDTLAAGTWCGTDPGTLFIAGATITTNNAFVMLSGAGSVFAAINGLATNNGWFTIANGRTFTAATLTNGVTGILAVGPGSTFTITGALNNDGTVSLPGGTLRALGGGTQTGAFILAGGTAEFAGNHTFTSSSSITGTGNLIFSGGTSVFNGTININGTITFTGNDETFNGTVTATGMSINSQSTVTFNNTASTGTLSLAGGTVGGSGDLTVSGALTWTGGTLQGSGRLITGAGITIILSSPATLSRTLEVRGTLQVSSTLTWTAGALQLNGGTLSILPGGILNASSTGGITAAAGTNQVANTGTINKTGAAPMAVAVPFSSTGLVSVQGGSLSLNGTIAQVSGSTLTGGSWSIAGGATLAMTGAAITTNSASITLAGPGFSFGAIGGLTANTGALTITGGAVLSIPSLNNTGTLSVGPGSTLAVTGTMTLSTGTTTLGGSLSVGTLQINAGAAAILSGDTSITGSVVNSGILTLGASTLSITGAFTQTATGTLNSTLNSATVYGRIAASGLATLAGSLSTTLAAGYAPARYSRFDALTASSRSGSFTSSITPAPPAAQKWVTLNLATGVQLLVTSTADWDNSGSITPSDVASFVNAWFTSLTQGGLAGDFDGNGVVEPADIATFVNIWFAAL